MYSSLPNPLALDHESLHCMRGMYVASQAQTKDAQQKRCKGGDGAAPRSVVSLGRRLGRRRKMGAHGRQGGGGEGCCCGGLSHDEGGGGRAEGARLVAARAATVTRRTAA